MAQSVIDLARLYYLARSESEAQADKLKTYNKARDEAESALLDAMVEEGVPSVTIDGLGLFSMTTTNYLSVTAAHKPDFYSYLKESGNGGLLKEDVNTRTLTSFLKGHLVEVTNKFVAEKGVDDFEAKKLALEFLKAKGADYFSERGISLRSKS